MTEYFPHKPLTAFQKRLGGTWLPSSSAEGTYRLTGLNRGESPVCHVGPRNAGVFFVSASQILTCAHAVIEMVRSLFASTIAGPEDCCFCSLGTLPPTPAAVPDALTPRTSWLGHPDVEHGGRFTKRSIAMIPWVHMHRKI